MLIERMVDWNNTVSTLLVQCYHFGALSLLSEDELGTIEAIVKIEKKKRIIYVTIQS